MTSKINYTQDEWEALCEAPLFVGGAVAASAPSGLIGTVKEGMYIVNSMLNAAKHHPGNQLIQDVVPKGIAREQLEAWANTARGLVFQAESERTKRAGVEACRKVANVLQSKSSPQEALDYKKWLLEIGEGVASSANEGGNFFNQGGTAYSPQEDQILRDMASVLGFRV